MLAAPVEPGLKCGHPMAGECAEVVAKCRVKATTSSSSRRGICGGGSKSLPAESICTPSRARRGGSTENPKNQGARVKSRAPCAFFNTLRRYKAGLLAGIFAQGCLLSCVFHAKNLLFQSRRLYCQKIGLAFVGIHQFMPFRTNCRKLLTAGGIYVRSSVTM